MTQRSKPRGGKGPGNWAIMGAAMGASSGPPKSAATTGPRARTKTEPKSAPEGVAGGGIALREAIITAPVLIDAESAAARVAGWIAEQPQAVALEALIAAHPTVKTLLESVSESSPHLWELVTRDAQRLLRLMVSEPEPHLAALLAAHGEAVADTQDFDDASRHLRHMKAEASLLIALADIGGVWPIMRCARALTALADAAVGAAVHFLLAEAARAGKLSHPILPHPMSAAATSCWRSARWVASSSIIRATSTSSSSTIRTRRRLPPIPSRDGCSCG